MPNGVDYTSTGMIASIKRRISLPDAQNLYTPDDLVKFMGDELSSTVEPLIHSVQQEYWVVRQDLPLVAGQTNYTLPIRGIVNGLRLVTLVDTMGNEMEFPRLQPEYQASAYSWLSPYTVSVLYGFTFEDDHIVVFPQSAVGNPTMSVRFRYERQPSQIVQTIEAAQITAVAGNIVTVSSYPSSWTTALLFDIIKGTPQFVSKGDDLTITLLDPILNQITFTALPSTVVVGDWVSVANTSPIPQIPYQLFPYLAQAVATKCLEGLSDLEPLQEAQKKLGLMKEDLLKMMQPRDMGNVQTVVNRSGLFNNGAFWGWGSAQGGVGF